MLILTILRMLTMLCTNNANSTNKADGRWGEGVAGGGWGGGRRRREQGRANVCVIERRCMFVLACNKQSADFVRNDRLS